MMDRVTNDGLNGASAQSCKTDRLTVWKVPCLFRQSIVGQFVAGKLLRLVLGRNVNGNAVKMLL